MIFIDSPCYNLEEYKFSLREYDFDVTQFSPAESIGSHKLALFDHVQLLDRKIGIGLYERGAMPQGVTVFNFSRQADIHFSNVRSHQGNISSTTAGAEFAMQAPSDSQYFSVAIIEQALAHYFNSYDIAQYLALSRQAFTGGYQACELNLKKHCAYLQQVFDYLQRHSSELTWQVRKDLQENVIYQTWSLMASGQSEQLRVNGRVKLLNRALAFIEDSREGFLSVADLIVGLGVSKRTLEQAFKEHLGVTPKRYLINRRLSRARQLLLEFPEQGVIAIARSLGVIHFGNFARDYRALFGELPSESRRIG